MTITPIQSTERAQVIAPATAATQAAPPASTTQDSESSATGYYFSPVLKIDPATQSVVIQYRNSQTGAVTNQYPSEKELKAYASQQKFQDLESEVGAASNTAAKTATQPAPTAVVDANAIKPTGFSSQAAAPAAVIDDAVATSTGFSSPLPASAAQPAAVVTNTVATTPASSNSSVIV